MQMVYFDSLNNYIWNNRANVSYTENVVWQDISHGGNFHDTTISFITAYGFYFHIGVIFAKKTIARKLPPRENFHIYSNLSWVLNACSCCIVPISSNIEDGSFDFWFAFTVYNNMYRLDHFVVILWEQFNLVPV